MSCAVLPAKFIFTSASSAPSSCKARPQLCSTLHLPVEETCPRRRRRKREQTPAATLPHHCLPFPSCWLSHRLLRRLSVGQLSPEARGHDTPQGAALHAPQRMHSQSCLFFVTSPPFTGPLNAPQWIQRLASTPALGADLVQRRRSPQRTEVLQTGVQQDGGRTTAAKRPLPVEQRTRAPQAPLVSKQGNARPRSRRQRYLQKMGAPMP